MSMKAPRALLLTTAIVLTTTQTASATDLPTGQVGPNIVLIVADDLGWADVGYHGSEIRTPSIDRIAREGIELDRFYAYPLCTPTRAALMTGQSAFKTGLDRPIGGAGNARKPT